MVLVVFIEMPIPGRWLLVVTGELPRHAGNNRVERGVFSVSAILIIITKLYSELWSFPRLLKIILMIDSSPNINFIILSENNGELCIFYALLVKIWYWMEMITPILYFIVLHRRSEEAGLSDIRPEMPASLFLIHFHVLEPIMSEITNVDVYH